MATLLRSSHSYQEPRINSLEYFGLEVHISLSNGDFMKRPVSLFLLFLFLTPFLFAGVGSKDATYVGGTVSAVKEGAEGKVSSSDDKVYTFTSKNGSFNIPYDRVEALEYGQ